MDKASALRKDFVDLINGFQDLAASAVNEGGRTLYGVTFGPDLSPEHRRLLDRMRRVLIKSISTTDATRGAARAEWPKLASTLEAELAKAKGAGIRASHIALVLDNLALVGEKHVKVRIAGPSERESAETYTDLMNGIRGLLEIANREWTDKRSGVVALNVEAVGERQRAALMSYKLGPNLSRRHRQLLESLRGSLILARTTAPGSARQAKAKWLAIQGDLRHVFERAPNFVVGDVAAIQADLTTLGRELIHGGAYSEAHQEALGRTELASPDEAYQIENLREAIKEVEQAKQLAEKGLQMTGESAIDAMLKDKRFGEMGKAIFELVRSPGEIKEAIQKFKEQGLIGKTATIADVADKTRAFATALAKVSFVSMKKFAEGAFQVALKSGALKNATNWWKLSEWAGEKIAFLDKIENAKIWKVKILSVVTVVISAIKIVDYISKGQWGKALEEAATTSAGLFASFAAGGAAGTALIGGIAIIIAAQAEGLAGAAAMIRYCRKANIREAAGDFVGSCMTAWDIGAKHFVADVKLLGEAKGSERAIAEQNLASFQPYWVRTLEELSGNVNSDRVNRIGGTPDLKKAIGREAIRILDNPQTWMGSWQQTAEHIQVMFTAANEVGKYVVKHYPRVEGAPAGG